MSGWRSTGSWPDEPLVEAFTALLDAGERERAARFRSDDHAHQFLVTRALQRSVLSCYVPEIAPADWRFVAGERGKPELAPEFAGHGLRFNVSHTAKLVVMAVTRAGLVGVGRGMPGGTRRAAGARVALFLGRGGPRTRELPGGGTAAAFLPPVDTQGSLAQGDGQRVSPTASPESRSTSMHAGNVEKIAMPADDPSRWQFWQGQIGEQHLVAIAASNPWGPLTLSVFRRLPAVELEYEPQPALRLVASASGQEQRAQS